MRSMEHNVFGGFGKVSKRTKTQSQTHPKAKSDFVRPQTLKCTHSRDPKLCVL